MHKSIALLPLLALCLIALPAGTQTPATPKSPSTAILYTNGPPNGDIDAFTINYGYAVTDSLLVPTVGSNHHASVTAISFWAWLFPNFCATCSLNGDYVTSVQVQIGNAAFDNLVFDGVVTSWVASNCLANAYGYEFCQETAVFRGPTLATNVTYWLTLQNAVTSAFGIANADPVYWDENSGPSLAEDNSFGTIPSESFTVLGSYSALDNPAAGAAQGKNPSGTPPRPSAVSSPGR